MSTGYEISDALIHAAKQAESLIEQLLEENARMKQASIGVLPDGTPVEEMLEELKQCKADYQAAMRMIDAINSIAITNNRTISYGSINRIRYIIQEFRK